MRKKLVMFFAAAMAGGVCFADMAFLYKSDADVLSGQYLLVPLTAEGALWTAEGALEGNKGMKLGLMSGELTEARLARLDNDLNVSVFRAGEPVSKTELLMAHKAQAEKMAGFLPDAEFADAVAGAVPTGIAISSSVAYQLKINDAVVGSDPTVLSFRRKSSEIDLALVQLSTAPVWKIDVELTSEPPLLFWTKGRQRTLTDVPSRKFDYKRQIFFKPLSAGKDITIPIEITKIKPGDYVWTLNVETKQGNMKQSFPVRFEK